MTEQVIKLDADVVERLGAYSVELGSFCEGETIGLPQENIFVCTNEEPCEDAAAFVTRVFINGTGAAAGKVLQWVLHSEEAQHREFTPAEMVALIRAVLSPNVTELAAMLRVERPTVYGWAAGEMLPKAKNLKRLRRIFRFAELVVARTARPFGPLIRTPGSRGASLVEMLSQEPIQDGEVLKELAVMISRLEDEPRKSTFRERAVKRGMDPTMLTSQEDNVDWITGKRAGPEPEV